MLVNEISLLNADPFDTSCVSEGERNMHTHNQTYPPFPLKYIEKWYKPTNLFEDNFLVTFQNGEQYYSTFTLPEKENPPYMHICLWEKYFTKNITNTKNNVYCSCLMSHFTRKDLLLPTE